MKITRISHVYFRNLNWRILGSVVILVGLSFLTLFSIAPSLLSQQALFWVLGFILFFSLYRTDYRLFKIFGRFFYLVAIAFLIALFLFAPRVRGTVRWFEIGGFQIQPSEFVKPLLILSFASILSSLQKFSFKNFFFLSLLVFIPIVLVAKQPDLGTAVVLFSLWLGMILVAGFPLKIFLFFLLVISVLLPQFWGLLKEYQKMRILTFLDPNLDPLGAGYNLIQAQIAVGSGRIFGKGLGFGTQSHLKFLPEQYSDFIFATLAEEAGFLGSLIVIGAFLTLIFQILATAKEAPDAFGCLFCVGVASQLLVQVFINIGMNIGLVPVTGITLPLVSYGGSSLISTLISLGIVASVGKSKRPEATVDIK